MISQMKKQIILSKNSIVTYLLFFEDYKDKTTDIDEMFIEALKRNRVFRELVEIAYNPEKRKSLCQNPIELVHRDSEFYDKIYESSTIEAQWKRLEMAFFDKKLDDKKRKSILEAVLYSVSKWEVQFLYQVFYSELPFIEREAYAKLRLQMPELFL